MLSGLPVSGTWVITRFPGVVITEGAGQNTLVSGITPGTFNFTVTNSRGCVSPASEPFTISQPELPSAPLIGEITQPTCQDPFGSILLTGLPQDQRWIITRSPDNISLSGNGNSTIITKLNPGTYSFTISDETSCISVQSGDAIILSPDKPTVTINDPAPVCFPETVDLTEQFITINSSPDLNYTYWFDIGATKVHETPETSEDGTYYIKGTDNSGCFEIRTVNVSVIDLPFADAGPDQYLNNIYETNMNAIIRPGETGIWSVLYGNAIISDTSDAETGIHELSPGENLFLWTVENELCGFGLDSVFITVQDSEINLPSLITPNADGKNDYLVIPGIEYYGRSELKIIDRTGVEVFKDIDYDNDWNGVDYNGNPLPEGTYFYLLKSALGKPKSSFIVIRR
jgi:gliding motility-associated-like protein